MTVISKLVHNNSRPDRVRLAELEKAVDRLALSVHRLEQVLADMSHQLDTVQRQQLADTSKVPTKCEQLLPQS